MKKLKRKKSVSKATWMGAGLASQILRNQLLASVYVHIRKCDLAMLRKLKTRRCSMGQKTKKVKCTPLLRGEKIRDTEGQEYVFPRKLGESSAEVVKVSGFLSCIPIKTIDLPEGRCVNQEK